MFRRLFSTILHYPYRLFAGFILLLLGLLLAYPIGSIYATNLPGNFYEGLVALGFKNPTNMVMAPDGRVFVLEQETVGQQGRGYVRVIKNDTLLSTPFLTLNNIAVDGEHGLVGLAFDPNFASNRYVYIFVTMPDVPNVAWHNEVWRYTADAVNGDVAQANSGVKVIHFPPLNSNHHNGGAMAFNPIDGNLYISIGEDDLGTTAVQQIDEFRGRFLRFTIHPDGTFSAPIDNPWYSQATTTINQGSWAMGFRNPHQFAIQPTTGRLFANDVGQDAWEEVNYVEAGKHYGWQSCEGLCNPANPAYTNPIHYYPHGAANLSTTGCAIIGSTFYNPTTPSYPAQYVGKYFFSDYCNNWIKYLNPDNPTQVTLFATNTYQRIVAMGVSPSGSLYYLARARSGGSDDGAVFRINYSETGVPPSFTEHPESQSLSAGQTATFTCVASSTTPITYQWQRRNPGSGSFVDIAGATGTNYTTPPTTIQAYNGAAYRCRATNVIGSTNSQIATLSVEPGTPPVVTINYTINGGTRRTWLLGDTIDFSFTATDAQEGTLPASAFTWSVDIFHEPPESAIHFHPVLPPTTGTTSASGSFMIGTVAHDRAHFWYQINLLVTDSSGLSTAATQIIESSLKEVPYNASITSLHPTLRWNAIPGASGYEVWLGTTDVPTTQYNVPSGAITSLTVPSNLLPSTVYYWYIKTLWSTGGSTTSDTWRFHIDSLAASAPTLQVYATTQPRLTWSSTSYATGYHVQVATNTSFNVAALVYDADVGNVQSKVVNANPALMDGQHYYWRVAAKRPDGTLGPYTPAQSFAIRTS